MYLNGCWLGKIINGVNIIISNYFEKSIGYTAIVLAVLRNFTIEFSFDVGTKFQSHIYKYTICLSVIPMRYSSYIL